MPQNILGHGLPTPIGNLTFGPIKMRKIKEIPLLMILPKHDILLTTAKKLQVLHPKTDYCFLQFGSSTLSCNTGMRPVCCISSKLQAVLLPYFNIFSQSPEPLWG